MPPALGLSNSGTQQLWDLPALGLTVARNLPCPRYRDLQGSQMANLSELL